MNCPNCKGYSLEPVKLENDLAALGCIKCKGALLPLISYREWSERHTDEVKSCKSTSQAKAAKEEPSAKFCPKCSKIMTKFRISSEADNKLDFCNGCYEAWLDSGEWQLIETFNLKDRLTVVFTESWQRRIRQEKAAEMYKQSYQNTFGSDYSKLKEIRQWLDGNKSRRAMLDYLNNPEPYGTKQIG